MVEDKLIAYIGKSCINADYYESIEKLIHMAKKIMAEYIPGMESSENYDLEYEMSGDKDKRTAFISVAATEIDAIGRMRTDQLHRDALIQLLKEMDGFDGEKGVFVLAATNLLKHLILRLTSGQI